MRDGAAGVWRWSTLDGNRLLIAFGLVLGFFLLLQLLYALGAIGYGDSSTVSRMASGMTAGSFSLITIVLTINQLILSQELGTAGKVESRLEGMMEFRERIESMTDAAATPARPVDMVALLARSTAEAATALSASVEDTPDDRLRATVEEYATAVGESSDGLAESVAERDSTFDALVTTFDYDDNWHVHAGRYLRNGNAERLSEESRDRFDELIELLKLFDVGRSHFETIYLRRELANLSRIILAVGVPAVTAAVLINLIYGAAPGAAIPSNYLPLAVSALSTVVFAPVAILASYILRAATVAYNNATVGPMVLGRNADRDLPEGAARTGTTPDRGGSERADGRQSR